MSSSTRAPATRPPASGNSRVFTHGGSRLFEFDQNGDFVREIGAGHLRLPLRARRPRRRAGQHLGRRRGREPGHQVRSRRPRADDDGPQAGSRSPCACRRLRRAGAGRRRRRRRRRRAGGGARSRRRRRSVQPADRRRLGRRRQHLRRRRPRQRARREVRQERPVPHVVGLARHPSRASSTRRTRSRSTRRATSTSPTRATSGSRCSTTTGTFKAQIANVGVPDRALHLARRASVPLQLPLRRSLRHGRRGDLQAGAGRPDRRPFGKAGKLPKEFGLVNAHRLPQRERAARRRALELARAEAEAGKTRTAIVRARLAHPLTHDV